MVTGVVVPVEEVVAMKVVLLVPPETVTDGCIVTKELLSESDTTNPPAGAFWLRVTVQVLLTPPDTVEGRQDTPVKTGSRGMIVIVPPVPDAAMLVPAPSDAITLASWIDEDGFNVDGERVKATVATTPFEI
jgi:hypothetical protein